MNKYKKTGFTVLGIKAVERAAWAYFTGSHEEGSTKAKVIMVSYQSYSNLRSFEDPLNDDLSVLLCSTDVL